jgi:hypothetical protein
LNAAETFVTTDLEKGLWSGVVRSVGGMVGSRMTLLELTLKLETGFDDLYM